jgi:lysophospholipase L1-like esterase
VSAPEKPRLPARIASALLGLVLSLGLVELGVRIVRPGLWDKPVLRDLDGQEQPLSSVIGYFREAGMTKDGERLLTNLLPHMVVRGCYDRPEWDYFDDDGCVEYRMNSLGFRDEEFARERPDGELRVLALGDSFTFGLGVQQADVWTEVLEERLAAGRDGSVQVINAGFACGAFPHTYLPWLEAAGLSLSPDVVILGFCLNDMGEIPMIAYDFGGASAQPGPSALWNLWKRTALRRQVEQAVKDKLSDPTAKQFDFGRVVEQDPTIWNATQAALASLHELTQQHGVRFVIAVFPMISRLSSDYPYAPLHDMMARYCDEQGIEMIDLVAPFMGLEDLDLWVHPTDQHPNDVGQALMGEAIADWLEQHP